MYGRTPQSPTQIHHLEFGYIILIYYAKEIDWQSSEVDGSWVGAGELVGRSALGGVTNVKKKGWPGTCMLVSRSVLWGCEFSNSYYDYLMHIESELLAC